MSKGYVKAQRHMTTSVCVFQRREVACRKWAYMDLMMMANHADAEILFDGQPLAVKRGQLVTSELKLMERWSWSKGRLRKFLISLEKFQEVDRKRDHRKTILTMLRYEEFQGSENSKETSDDTSERPVKIQSETSDDTQTRRSKKNKNEKKEEERTLDLFPDRDDPRAKERMGNYCYISKFALDQLKAEEGDEVVTRALAKLDNWIGSDPTPTNQRKGQNAEFTLRSWVITAIKTEMGRGPKKEMTAMEIYLESERKKKNGQTGNDSPPRQGERLLQKL